MQNRAAPQAAKRRKIRPFWRIFRRFLRFVRLFPVLLRQLALAPGGFPHTLDLRLRQRADDLGRAA